MGKVDARQSFLGEMTGNSSATPYQLGEFNGNPGVNTTASPNTVTTMAPKVANELLDAVLSVGAPKSNNSGKTVQSSSQSVAGTNQPSASSLSVGTQEQDLMSQLIAMSQANTAQEQEFAREQMAFQEAQNAKAMEFNAEQAQINRDWQKMMSDTAHQREVADMMAAGINPVLSVAGGNGATVTSGATASGVTSSGSKGSVDTNVTSALASMFGALINAQTMENVARISANSAQAVAGINAGSAMAVQESRNAQERYIYQNYPSTLYQFASANLNPNNPNSSLSNLINNIKNLFKK